MQVAYERKDAGMGIGDGLFALQKIESGTLVWKFSAGVNVNIYNGEESSEKLAKFKDIQDAQVDISKILYHRIIFKFQIDK